MGFGIKVEGALGADGLDHDVALFVGADGNGLVGQIAELEDGGHLGCFEVVDLLVEVADAVAEGTHVGDFGVAQGGVFERADFFGGGVTVCLEAFDLGQQGAALFVEAQDGVDGRGIDARTGEGRFDDVGLFTEQADVEHEKTP